MLVGLARGDCRSLHVCLLRRAIDCETLGRSHGSDKIFNCAIILDAWRHLNAAANFNRVWHDGFDGLADVLRVQTARENKKSREGKRCSRRRPIASQSRAATQSRMIRIEKHIALRKRSGILRLELAAGRESSNDAKFASQLTARIGRHTSV